MREGAFECPIRSSSLFFVYFVSFVFQSLTTARWADAAANLDAGALAGDARAPPTGEIAMRRLLLFVPFIAVLWLPFYNVREPQLFGFPFFYWYLLLWVPMTSVVIWIVHAGRTR
jgi:hypothetical protein